MNKIRLLGTEEGLDKSFYVIMTSGESSICLRNEIYIVNDKILLRLKEQNIKIEVFCD